MVIYQLKYFNINMYIAFVFVRLTSVRLYVYVGELVNRILQVDLLEEIVF